MQYICTCGWESEVARYLDIRRAGYKHTLHEHSGGRCDLCKEVCAACCKKDLKGGCYCEEVIQHICEACSCDCYWCYESYSCAEGFCAWCGCSEQEEE